MENKFKEGEVVQAKDNPTLNLVVRRYVDRIYYCMIQKHPNQKELVYFERELIPHDKKNTGQLTSKSLKAQK
jgi:uncharacterized protein YodC (DUF2158 family)